MPEQKTHCSYLTCNKNCKPVRFLWTPSHILRIHFINSRLRCVSSVTKFPSIVMKYCWAVSSGNQDFRIDLFSSRILWNRLSSAAVERMLCCANLFSASNRTRVTDENFEANVLLKFNKGFLRNCVKILISCPGSVLLSLFCLHCQLKGIYYLHLVTLDDVRFYFLSNDPAIPLTCIFVEFLTKLLAGICIRAASSLLVSICTYWAPIFMLVFLCVLNCLKNKMRYVQCNVDGVLWANWS